MYSLGDWGLTAPIGWSRPLLTVVRLDGGELLEAKICYLPRNGSLEEWNGLYRARMSGFPV